MTTDYDSLIFRLRTLTVPSELGTEAAEVIEYLLAHLKRIQEKELHK